MTNEDSFNIRETLTEIRKIAEKHSTSFLILIFSFSLVIISLIQNNKLNILLTFWTLIYALANHYVTIFRKYAADSELIENLFNKKWFVVIYYLFCWFILIFWAVGIISLMDGWIIFSWI